MAWPSKTPWVLYIDDDLPLIHKVVDLTPKTNHNLTLNSIETKKLYHYHVEVGNQSSRLYEFDSTFDYSKIEIANLSLPPKTDKYAKIAKQILEECKVNQGYGLILGTNQGRLALELVKQTNLHIICVDPNLDNVKQTRENLDVAGVYGIRSTVHYASFKQLSYVDYFANLIIVQEKNILIEEILRFLRPAGGVAYIDKDIVGLPSQAEGFEISPSKLENRQILQRGGLPGSGAWSHQYGEPANTTCSQDKHPRDPMRVLSFGRPGPRTMVDRGTHVSAPLAINGRLYIQGDRRLFGLDAYNGTILWSIDVPDLRRTNIPRDSGNRVSDGDYLYVAVKDKCWKINGNNGEIVGLFEQVTLGYEWGYVAYAEKQLFGSSVKKGGIYVGADGEWYDKNNEGSQKVVSEDIFAVDPTGGNEIWRYTSGFRIINSTIAIGGDRVYFVVSRNSQLIALASGRFGHELVADRIMVALDAKTGRKIWEQPYAFKGGSWIFFLSYADEVLVNLITSNKYHLFAFEAENGDQIWNQEYGWRRNHHGGAMYHPLIVGNKIYAEPKVFDLKTGKILSEKIPDRSGCNTMSASATALFYRDSYHGMWDLQQNKRHKWTGLRPGCSLSTISAGGIVLSPESSAGCYCSYTIQTPIAFVLKFVESTE